MCSRIGFAPTGSIGFGRRKVYGRSLVPSPPARITAWTLPISVRGGTLRAEARDLIPICFFGSRENGGVDDESFDPYFSDSCKVGRGQLLLRPQKQGAGRESGD